jgi:hypothetical protein
LGSGFIFNKCLNPGYIVNLAFWSAFLYLVALVYFDYVVYFEIYIYTDTNLRDRPNKVRKKLNWKNK